MQDQDDLYSAESRATECFCGCGRRIMNPRSVVTNANGWDVRKELAEWVKVAMILPIDDDSEQVRFTDDGRSYWVALADALHAGERPARADEANAARWGKFSRKSRRKVARHWRRRVCRCGRSKHGWVTQTSRPPSGTRTTLRGPTSASG